ncbi:MAG: protein translocase subunit SecF [Rhodospirillaceae bacterium]|jgi:preprotein translocase SecF subunit|nr:protein translocase subunit SecF [Rhodospirillaceae bacterium]MBT3491486.1 protein translocase subunit SecF [Rhodospirillaceae bacterium]MBT3778408.1 protein translocase subunit SecF [Rhodospirillaceae bacterium]MBT3978818.1 protein translocase subunit SecF [Rhodospirillaceae bacterium]MBT4169117.1 protein translocase subunit SecF [Rhodospirillaceae bacterium]
MFQIKLVPTKTNIPFVNWRKPAMAISALLVLISVVMAFVPGPNFGIDFRGGILIEVQTKGPADLSDLRTKTGGLGLGEISLQEFGSVDTVLIRIEKQPGDATAQQKAVAKVRAALGGDLEYRRTEFVGPKVSGELIEAGAIAIALSVVLMLIYIWFRFEWHFGVGAVVALVHDVTLSVGMFAITQMEFNLSTIAALLTIVGYSINDTVVVYDRVRENLRKYKSMELTEVLNLSINDTLSRTSMTSVTTLLALVALFIFGGAVIQGFVFAMIWGVIVGTYSSIFIAAPLLIVLGLGNRHRSGEDQGTAQTSS